MSYFEEKGVYKKFNLHVPQPNLPQATKKVVHSIYVFIHYTKQRSMLKNMIMTSQT